MIFYASLLLLSLTSAALAAPIYNNNASLNGSPSPTRSQLDSSPPCPNDAGMSSNSSCMPVGMTGAPLPRANGTLSSGLSSNTTEGGSSSNSSSTGSSGSPSSSSTTLLPRDNPSHILLSRSEPEPPSQPSLQEIKDGPTTQQLLQKLQSQQKTAEGKLAQLHTALPNIKGEEEIVPLLTEMKEEMRQVVPLLQNLGGEEELQERTELLKSIQTLKEIERGSDELLLKQAKQPHK